MKPLTKDHVQDPVWQCWLAHVAHITFCVRDVFTPADAPMLDILHGNFLAAFEAVLQWQDEGYEKPKFHPASHFAETLADFGPMTASWCYPFEGFLKPLKHMFRMSNWKCAVYDVAVNWATKSVMHYRDPARGSWHQDEVCATSEYVPLNCVSVAGSWIVRALQKVDEPPYSVRFLSSFSRGPDEVRLGDWLLLQQSDSSTIGRLDSMVQATYPSQGASLVRLLCTQCKTMNMDEAGCMWTKVDSASRSLLVWLELMQVRVVSRTVSGEREEYIA